MSQLACSAQFLQRAALLLALICFWISGPVATHHTDAPEFFAAGQSHFQQTAPPAPDILCTACEWEQVFSHPFTPSVHIAYLPLLRVRYAAALPAALHRLSFDFIALRGPPSLLS